jgi:hypothetical protein
MMDDVEFLPEPSRLPHRRRTDPQPASNARLFERKDSTALFGMLKIAGGVLVLMFAAVMFAIHLFTRSSQFAMQATTTLPVLLGIGLISAGIAGLRSPSHVAVDSQGVIVTRGRVNRRLAWGDIGLASAGSSPLSYRRRLSLFAPDGKLLERIPDSFGDFEQLVQLVRENVEEKTAGTSGSLLMQKSRRHVFWMVPFSCLMAIAALAIGWKTWDTNRGNELLTTGGVEGEGKVLRHFLAPNGVTCRLEYEVTGDKGQTATRNAEVEPEYWQELEGEPTVPIRYVPAEPKFSRLLEGEVPSRDELSGKEGYFLAGAGAVISVLILAGAALQFYGWDFGKNPKTGQVGFFKLGT